MIQQNPLLPQNYSFPFQIDWAETSGIHSPLKPQPILANLNVGLFLPIAFGQATTCYPINQSQSLGFPLTQMLKYQSKQTVADLIHLWWLMEFISLPSSGAILSSQFSVFVYSHLSSYLRGRMLQTSWLQYLWYLLSVSMKHTELILTSSM